MKLPLLITFAALTSFGFAQETKPAAPATPATPAPAAPAAPATPAAPAAAGEVAKLKLGVIPAVMKFDKAELECKAGQKVMLLFTNEKCPLQHNVCIIKPGTKDKVSAAALTAMADPNFMKNNCFVDSPDVLFKGNKLVGIGQSDLMEFTAPAAGDYPYICTFPGHTALMHGVLHVK
jgi:azurin